MGHLMLVNGKKKKRKATPKQLTALRRARAARGHGKKKRRRARATATPVKRHRARRLSASETRNIMRRQNKRYKHNPTGFSMKNFVKSALIPSAMGAGGALGLDLAMAYLPLPAQLKTPGPIRSLVRIAGAVGLGLIGSKIAGRQVGAAVGAGALTVVLYSELKTIIQKQMPTLMLGDNDYPALEYISPGEMAAYEDESTTVGNYVSEYVSESEYSDDGM